MSRKFYATREGRMLLGVGRAIFIAFLIVCPPSSTWAGPKEDAYAAVEQWANAFNASDVDKVVASYAPDALLLGTVSPILASNPDEFRKYFASLPTSKTQVKIGDYSAMVVSNEAVLFVGFYEFSRMRDGQLVATPARFSMLAVKRGDRWLLGHHHSSARP